LIFLLFQICYSYSQDGFKFVNNKNKIVIPIKMSNNLVVAPLEINGVNLNFLIDTGVENTILFSLEEAEAVDFKNVEKIKIKGLGSGEAIDAFKSSSNTISLNEYIDTNHEIYIILDQDINFSAQLGIPVHGILGYHFFKNHLVEVNPISKKIIVYRDAKVFNKKKLKKYSELPISIELEKPYVKAKVKINNKITDVKLLVDTGGSDAIWLFENDTSIKCPSDFFEDFLGRGFSGDIFGKRSRIEQFTISDIDLENPTVSFPSANSVKSVELVEGRNGSLGSAIMRRFDVVFDYPNSKLYLKKNKDFDDPFNYNMSGMEVQHNGKEIIKEEVLKTNFVERDSKGNPTIDFEKSHNIKYQFLLKPIYEISNVRTNSPSYLAGIRKGDVIRRLNGELAYKMKLSDIIEMLQSEEGKWINIEFERKGITHKTKFQLKKIL
jgi:hypothetical protein